MAKKKKDKMTNTDKPLHRKLKIEQYELHWKPGMNFACTEMMVNIIYLLW
jgi:hypothetical protein